MTKFVEDEKDDKMKRSKVNSDKYWDNKRIIVKKTPKSSLEKQRQVWEIRNETI